MFTGIIEEIGTIVAVKNSGGGIKIRISAPKSLEELAINDSVAINGVCQTVTNKDKNYFEVEAVEETLKKTTLRFLTKKSKVNIELPMRLNSRLGGHLVLGHVDTVGKIVKINKVKSSWLYQVNFPKIFCNYVVNVGSIAIDGVSLTIADFVNSDIIVSIIPHTMKNTIFQYYKIGTKVNLEFDIIGKYIESILSHSIKNLKNKKLRETDLLDAGF